MSSYIGELPAIKDDDRFYNEFIKQSSKAGTVQVIMLFMKKYHLFPCITRRGSEAYTMLPYKHTMKILKEKYNHDKINDIITYSHLQFKEFTYVYSQVCEIADGVIVHFLEGTLASDIELDKDIEYDLEEYMHVFKNYAIYHSPGKEEFVKEFLNSLKYLKFKEIVPETYLHMICKSQHGFYTTPILVKKPKISDLKLHYGEEFEDVHKKVIDALKSEDAHGLILLHGLPGSGKTHYIRYLIQEITEKQMIYVPPDMTSSISSPEFFPFMLQNRNSVLIIEDAENIIKSRDSKETTTQAVANLLNLSDGLLSDSLHQPIIATFNCEINSVDTALLRKGRLIANYEFGKLNVENAQKLSDQLGFTTKISEPLTLADIYNQDKATENSDEL